MGVGDDGASEGGEDGKGGGGWQSEGQVFHAQANAQANLERERERERTSQPLQGRKIFGESDVDGRVERVLLFRSVYLGVFLRTR